MRLASLMGVIIQPEKLGKAAGECFEFASVFEFFWPTLAPGRLPGTREAPGSPREAFREAFREASGEASGEASWEPARETSGGLPGGLPGTPGRLPGGSRESGGQKSSVLLSLVLLVDSSGKLFFNCFY